jgi:hypothetical protein
MRWFRKNIGHGSWAALIALAINLALSFGHVHAIDGKGPGHPAGALAVFVSPDDSDHGPGQPDGDHPDYLCPICLASTAIASAIAPTPPALPVEFVIGMIDQPIEHARSVVEPQHPAYQSRGPPIS